MCQTLLESEQHLHVIVTARNFVQGTFAQKSERSKIKEIMTDNAFVNNLRKALAILASIDALIVKYQSNKVPIFEVMPNFHNLPAKYKKVMSSNIITRQEFEYLVILAQRRFQFMYGVAHSLSYLLDPRHIGDGLPANSRNSLEEVLINNHATMLRPLTTTARRSYTFNSRRTSFLQQRRGMRTPSVTRCCPRD
jgi:hypothetical protein